MLKTQHIGPLPTSFVSLVAVDDIKDELTTPTSRRSARSRRETGGDIDTTTRRQVAIISKRNEEPEEGALRAASAQKRHLVSPEAGSQQQQQQVPSKQHNRGRQESGQEDDTEQVEPLEAATGEKREEELRGKEFKAQLVWTNIILFVILHSSFPVAIYQLYTQRPWKTLAFSILGMYLSALGVTGGTHRLWSHRSYKAKWPVQVLLVALQTMAGQNSIYTWSRDHRVHHKYSETDADPHNIKRGFFFAHMGWLCCKKHPDVKEKGKAIDMSDLEANPYVMFQHRHFWWLAILFTVLVPTMVPVLCWGERFWTSFIFSFMVRYLITLHGTWLVNSAAHYYGHRPYDTNIEARESASVIYTGLGEGFHNYHHTFPYDYATSEFGRYLNITTAFIDLCALLGLVEGRRKVDQETIMRRRKRTGDLSEAELAKKRKSKISSPSKACNPEEHAPALNSLIHELPYISGLTSMKYTM